MQVALVGLGVMGKNLALNLIEKRADISSL